METFQAITETTENSTNVFLGLCFVNKLVEVSGVSGAQTEAHTPLEIRVKYGRGTFVPRLHSFLLLLPELLPAESPWIPKWLHHHLAKGQAKLDNSGRLTSNSLTRSWRAAGNTSTEPNVNTIENTSSTAYSFTPRTSWSNKTLMVYCV